MSRTFRTAMLLAVTVLAGCKTRQADPAPTARPTAPARSTPSAAPALPDPPKPADPAAPAAPAPPGATAADGQARSIAAMQHLADTLAADAKDCEKLAVDLQAFIAENKPLLAQLIAAANRPGDPQVADRAAAAAAARRLQTAMTTCAANSSVAAAMKDLPQ